RLVSRKARNFSAKSGARVSRRIGIKLSLLPSPERGGSDCEAVRGGVILKRPPPDTLRVIADATHPRSRPRPKAAWCSPFQGEVKEERLPQKSRQPCGLMEST